MATSFAGRMPSLCPWGKSACCVPSNAAARQRSAAISSAATNAAMSVTHTTRALWGVISNGEFGLGIHAGLAFSTGLGGRRLTIISGASATLMRPSMANAQQGEPMLETYFSSPQTLRRLRGGISGPHIDSFADDLEREGYAPSSSVRYIRAASHLGCFVQRKGGVLKDIDLTLLDSFRSHLRRSRCPPFNPGKFTS